MPDNKRKRKRPAFRVAEDFARYVRLLQDKKYLNAFRNALRDGAQHFEPHIAAACTALNLNPHLALDRELLLGILARVHFPYVNRYNMLAGGGPPPKRGNPNFRLKWDDDKTRRELYRDIRQLYRHGKLDLSNPARPPPVSEIARLLKEHYPDKKQYSIGHKKLTEQLRKRFRRGSP